MTHRAKGTGGKTAGVTGITGGKTAGVT